MKYTSPTITYRRRARNQMKCFFCPYLPDKMHDKRQSRCIKILHANFASKATLKACMSRMPRPPSDFAFVSFSHASQHICLLVRLESYQNHVRTDWTLTKTHRQLEARQCLSLDGVENTL